MTLSSDSCEQLFYGALELSGEERDRFLDERCGQDSALRREVELLLRADTEVDAAFLERTSALGESDVLRPGMELGSYRILERIGEGGMGTVYAARQESPRRDVALKVIRPDRLSRSALRRFRHEAEVLGSLQHGGIAQVFEAGTAETELANGTRIEQPFLVMELVRGEPLLDFVAEHRVDRRGRLELLARVCDAVHHAHQRGIIHRDLKPENVLVTTAGESEVGMPKVLDFGIARAIAEDVDAETMQTRAGQLIGSLASMSPEQVSGDRHRVDVRSDVYALGVLLYRLLAGRIPIEIEGCTVPEAVRRVSEGNVPRLSSWDASLRGDLTVIAARALEVDKERRYASAADLATDLRRHLEGAPIVARTDSALYVLGKTIRRHRTASVAAAIVLVLLVVLAVVSSLQAARLQRELTASTIERGRLTGVSGNFLLAEEMLWRVFLQDPDSRHAYWALWELYARNPCLGSWPSNVDERSPVAIHPNGNLFASGRGEPGVVLWDAHGAGPLRALEVDEIVLALDFHPDGTTLACGTESGRLSIRSVARDPVVEDRPARDVEAHTGPLLVLAHAPDGSLIASAGSDGTVRAWEPDASALVAELEGHRAAVRALAFHPDGALLASAGTEGEILLWRELAGPPVARLSSNGRVIRALDFSPDGRVLVSGGDGRDVFLWDTASGGEPVTLSAQNGPVRFLGFRPGASTSLLSSGWWKVLAWNLESGGQEPILDHGFHHGALTAAGDRLVAVADRHLRLWDLEPSGSIRLGGLEGAVHTDLDPSSGRIAATDRSGNVRLHAGGTGELLAEHRLGMGHVGTLAFHPDGSVLALGLADRIALLDPGSGAVSRMIEDHDNVTRASIAFTPDGRQLAHTSGPKVRVHDVRSGEVRTEIRVTQSQALGVAFSPDGAKLATTFRTYRPPEFGVRVWTPTGELLWESLTSPTMFGQDSTLDIIPWRPSFSGDGTTLAAGGWGNLILVWDAESGSIEAVLRDHKAMVWDVAFRPSDRDTLASVSDDGTVKLWDVREERCLVTLASPLDDGRATNSIQFDRDGESLLAGGHGGATLWDLTYFDRHVAGNLPFQLARFESELGERIARVAVTEWARATMQRPRPKIPRGSGKR